jgi:hypothetical protein
MSLCYAPLNRTYIFLEDVFIFYYFDTTDYCEKWEIQIKCCYENWIEETSYKTYTYIRWYYWNISLRNRACDCGLDWTGKVHCLLQCTHDLSGCTKARNSSTGWVTVSLSDRVPCDQPEEGFLCSGHFRNPYEDKRQDCSETWTNKSWTNEHIFTKPGMDTLSLEATPPSPIFEFPIINNINNATVCVSEVKVAIEPHEVHY